jgi:menaquinone-dependent protoporphyrinogen oxidase
MNKRVLIIFGSKYGSTAEIANKIGQVLQESGLDTDVTPAKSANKPDTYDAVVLGSSVNVGSWRKESAKYLRDNLQELKTKAVWIFSSGPTGEGDPVELAQGWRVPKNLKVIINSIQPRNVTVFHGNVDVTKLSRLHKWMIGKVEAPVGDFRDWDAIARWAKSIADALQG